MYGIGAIREKKQVQLSVHLEKWDDKKNYDHLGDSLQVVWNDSVICDKVITESDSAVGFPVGSAGLLMISDVGSGVTASSNVSEEGGCFELYRDRGELFIKSVPDNKE